MQGCEPELRVEVWPYLLRLDSPSANRVQRYRLRAELSHSYARLQQRCQVSIVLRLKVYAQAVAQSARLVGGKPSQALDETQEKALRLHACTVMIQLHRLVL